MITYVYQIDGKNRIQIKDGELYSVISGGNGVDVLRSIGFDLRFWGMNTFDKEERAEKMAKLHNFIHNRNWGMFVVMLANRGKLDITKQLKSIGWNPDK